MAKQPLNWDNDGKALFQDVKRCLCAALRNEYTCPKETVLQTRNFGNLEVLKHHGSRNGLKAIGSQLFEWKIKDFWVTNAFIKLLTFFTVYCQNSSGKWT